MKFYIGKWYRTPFNKIVLLKIEKSPPSRDVWTVRVLAWTIHVAIVSDL